MLTPEIILHNQRTLLKRMEVAEVLECSLRELDRKYSEWGLRRMHLTDDRKSLRYLAEDVKQLILKRMEAEHGEDA